MANIFRMQNLLDEALRKEPLVSEEHQFIRGIIGHIDYIFERIVEKKVEIQTTKMIPHEQMSQANSTSKDEKQLSHSLASNHENQKMMNQIYDQDEDASIVPSIEQISNFDERSSEKSFKKKKNIKKKKGKNKMNKLQKFAKKPVSSFVYFYKDRLKVIKKQKEKSHDTINIGNLAKIISKEWKQLSEEQKRPYVAKAELSIKTYYHEKERINSKLEAKQKKQMKPLVQPNEMGRVDLPISKNQLASFFTFFKENTKRFSRIYGQCHRNKLARIASDEWKKLTNQERHKYQKLSLGYRQKNLEKQVEKIHQTHQSVKKKHKVQEEQYMPKNYKNKPSKQPSQSSKIELLVEQKMENEKGQIPQLKVIKIKSLASEDKLKLNDNDLKNEEIKALKHPNLQMNIRSKLEEQKNQGVNNAQNFTVIQVESDDENLSQNQLDELESLNNDSYSIQDAKNNEKGQAKKPKGPTSPFLLFYQRTVKKLRKSNLNTHGSELIRLASTKWGELTEDERMYYQNESRKSREKVVDSSFKNNSQGKEISKRKNCGEEC